MRPLSGKTSGRPSAVIYGETEDWLVVSLTKHAKEIHLYNDEQPSDPEVMESIKTTVRQEWARLGACSARARS